MNKPENVNNYINQFPSSVQLVLQEVRKAIKTVVPEAEEYISYGMPAYKYHGILVYFAAFKNHIGFYATPTGHAEFARRLSGYKQGKGSVQFPLDKTMPLELISDIVKFRMQENLDRMKKKLSD